MLPDHQGESNLGPLPSMNALLLHHGYHLLMDGGAMLKERVGQNF